MSHQNLLDFRPVDHLVQLFEGAQTPVFFDGTGQRQAGKPEIAVNGFESDVSALPNVGFAGSDGTKPFKWQICQQITLFF